MGDLTTYTADILDDTERYNLLLDIDSSTWDASQKAQAKQTLDNYRSPRVKQWSDPSQSFDQFFCGGINCDADITSLKLDDANIDAESSPWSGNEARNYSLTAAGQGIRNGIICMLQNKYKIGNLKDPNDPKNPRLTLAQQGALDKILQRAGGDDGNINKEQLQNVLDYIIQHRDKDNFGEDTYILSRLGKPKMFEIFC